MINRYDIEKNRNKSTQEQKTIKTPTTPSVETATKIATTMLQRKYQNNKDTTRSTTTTTRFKTKNYQLHF